MRAQCVGRRIGAVALAAATGLLGVLVGVPGSATAAVAFTVNSTVDAPDAAIGNGVCAASNGACTLRAAVQESNSAASAATINVPAGTFVLNAPSPGSLVGAPTRSLQLASNITIVGAGAGTTVIAGQGSRVLDVQNYLGKLVIVSVSRVTIQSGSADIGGGILTGPDVTFSLTDSIVASNIATNAGGGLYAYGVLGKSASVTLTRVWMGGNVSNTGGGIVNTQPVRMTLVDTTVTGNQANGLYGGGIVNSGAMTVSNGTITNNKAGFSVGGGGPGGGGVYNGNPPAGTRSSFVMNGGTIANNLVPSNLPSSGGGLINETNGDVVLDGVVVSGNGAFTGGGILNDEGVMTVFRSTITANAAIYGGGLYNNDFIPTNGVGASMTVNRSAVYGNTATDYLCPYNLTGGQLCGAGGGLFNENGDLTVVNSTVGENYASSYAGGIYNLRIGTGQVGQAVVRLLGSTVARNSAGRDAGGILDNTGTYHVKNSIVADNLAGSGVNDCYIMPGSVSISFGTNLTSTPRCGFANTGDRFGSALLGPLQFNGGPTATMVPDAGSLAVNAADNGFCAAGQMASVDQRGVGRPVGGTCDIGSVEGSTPAPPRTNNARPVTSVNGNFSFRPTLTSGPATSTVGFGLATDMPLMCDFDGDGTRSITIVRRTGGYLTWFGRPSNTGGLPTVVFAFGGANDTPICGDWNGDGVDSPGITGPNGGVLAWVLADRPDGTGGQTWILYGAATDKPIIGDWDGNGTDTIGVYNPYGPYMSWALRNANSTGPANAMFLFGTGVSRPVVGDWDGNGTDTPGIVGPEGLSLRWWYSNRVAAGAADGTFVFGSLFDKPMVWKGSGSGGF